MAQFPQIFTFAMFLHDRIPQLIVQPFGKNPAFKTPCGKLSSCLLHFLDIIGDKTSYRKDLET